MSSYGEYRPRRKKERPSAAAVVLLVCILGTILSVILLVSITQETSEPLPDEAPAPAGATIKHDSLAPTYTHDGEIIRWYVFTDPDSGVQYLVNDRGGCTPRLGTNGHVMGVQDEDL